MALGGLCAIGLLVLAMAFAEDMFAGAWAASMLGYWLAHRMAVFRSASQRLITTNTEDHPRDMPDQ
jgi:hypothetical protein